MILADVVLARVVLLLVLALIVRGIYDVPVPFCLTGEMNYVPPSQLYRGVILMCFISPIFGVALAVFGPRWRVERLRPR